LPTSLINCLLVASDDTVYAGTTTGLARSSNNGLTWRFLRGADWEANVNGLYHGPKPLPADAQGLPLLEDYVTCLADDGAGHLLVGHRQQGMESVSLKGDTRLFPSSKDSQPTDYVTALLPLPDGTALLGSYGGGLLQRPLPGVAPQPAPPVSAAAVPAPAAVPALPSPAKPPTLAELKAMLRVVSAISPDKAELQPRAVTLDDDWVTEGDWLGRYGRYWACLCAMSYAPLNYIWGAGGQKVDYRTRVGPNHNPGDKLRYWVTWPYTTDPRSLELPPTYLDSRVRKKLTTWEVNRRQSEADDHGEAYLMSQDGPHVHCNLTVPPGLYVLSVYDFNKDAHGYSSNRFRDYRLSLRPLRKTMPLKDTSYFDQQLELAQSRIRDFWGGVWKRFLVRGPLVLGVQVNRNNSFNTILPAVVLDSVDEEPSPYFQPARQRQARHTAGVKEPASDGEAANRLFDKLVALRLTNSVWWAMNGGRFYQPLLRWYRAQYDPTDTENKRLLARMGTCYYQLGMFAPWEYYQNKRGLMSARQMEKQLHWDGVTNTDSDHDVVTKFIVSHPEVKASNYRAANASSR